jgi:DNA-binding NarL/FixJ family response regulator
MTLGVLITDDQALMRAGFRMILEVEPDLEVVGEAADGREALAEADRLRPDVVLMDVRMPEMNGIEATRRLLDGNDHTKVVMLTTSTWTSTSSRPFAPERAASWSRTCCPISSLPGSPRSHRETHCWRHR